MSKISFLILSIAMVAVTLPNVFAFTDEDKVTIREVMGPIIEECSSAHGVSDGDISKARGSFSTDGLNSCFLGCVLKKLDFIDNKGLLNVENGLNKGKGLLKNHDDFGKLEAIGKLCSKVNEAPVSDGDAGCERAQLAFKCAIENKVEIPI